MATRARVHFEDEGGELTAVQIGTDSRSPVISKLHGVLFALGVVVSSYQLRAHGMGLIERVELQRRDGGAVVGKLAAEAKAAILPVALEISEGGFANG